MVPVVLFDEGYWRSVINFDKLVEHGAIDAADLTLFRFADTAETAWDALLGVVDFVHPIELEDVTRARRLAETAPRLSARDAVHLAVMQRHGITRILSFDAGFDGMVGIERIGV